MADFRLHTEWEISWKKKSLEQAVRQISGKSRMKRKHKLKSIKYGPIILNKKDSTADNEAYINYPRQRSFSGFDIEASCFPIEPVRLQSSVGDGLEQVMEEIVHPWTEKGNTLNGHSIMISLSEQEMQNEKGNIITDISKFSNAAYGFFDMNHGDTKYVLTGYNLDRMYNRIHKRYELTFKPWYGKQWTGKFEDFSQIKIPDSYGREELCSDMLDDGKQPSKHRPVQFRIFQDPTKIIRATAYMGSQASVGFLPSKQMIGLMYFLEEKNGFNRTPEGLSRFLDENDTIGYAHPDIQYIRSTFDMFQKIGIVSKTQDTYTLKK
ncbi:MAG: hypothetical protein KKF44_10900 [Nanoarchaeota archaeon]|nr:hypothetical protein [Nanoarchaeota archaeon]